LSSRQFLYFWHTGKMINVRETFLCRHNEAPAELLLILDGVVSIRKNGLEIATLERGDFVAEMSFLTGEPASADAFVVGKARCVVWSHDKLRQLEELDRDLFMKLQLVLGRDISHKLREAHPTRAYTATEKRSAF
jgi:CRP-like cAMP-binding protein